MKSIFSPSSSSCASSSSRNRSSRPSRFSSSLLLVLSLFVFFTTSLISTTEAGFLDQCTIGVSALLTDPRVNACIPLQPLADLMTSDTITPKFVNDTTTTFCGMPNCASTTVTLIENTVNQNCLNSTDDYAGMQFIYGAAALYVPLKQGLCQRVPSTPPKINGTFCLTVLTDSLERYIKQHPKIKNWEVFLNATLLQQYIDSMPDSLLCTDCNKSIITPVISYVSVKQLALDSDVVGFVRAIQFAIQRRCGVNFVDGIAPAPSPTTSNPKSQGQGSRSLLLGSGASLLWSLTSGTAVAFLVLTLVNYWWL